MEEKIAELEKTIEDWRLEIHSLEDEVSHLEVALQPRYQKCIESLRFQLEQISSYRHELRSQEGSTGTACWEVITPLLRTFNQNLRSSHSMFNRALGRPEAGWY